MCSLYNEETSHFFPLLSLLKWDAVQICSSYYQGNYTYQDWFQLITIEQEREKTIISISSGCSTLTSNKESNNSCRATCTKRSKVFCTKGMLRLVINSFTWNQYLSKYTSVAYNSLCYRIPYLQFSVLCSHKGPWLCDLNQETTFLVFEWPTWDHKVMV